MENIYERYASTIKHEKCTSAFQIKEDEAQMKHDRNYILLSLFVLCLIPADVASMTRWPFRPSAHKKRILQVPANFGKTNFIVGLPADYVQQNEPVTDDVVDQQPVNEAYFSPDDDLQKKLIEYIQQEKKGIHLAIFSFTDKEIADAISAAHRRGVHVEMVVDVGFLSDRFTKVDHLQACGITIYLYNPKQSQNQGATMSNIMHNKFALFDRNINGKSLVWTGSYNFTKSARLNNQENVVVLSNAGIVAKFRAQFAALKKRTIPYNPTTKKSVHETKKDKK